MARKHTLLFNWKGTQGWSETFYYGSVGSASESQLLIEARRIAAARALVLTPSAKIQAVRSSVTSVPGVSYIFKLNVPGSNTQLLSSNTSENPSQAILVNLIGASGAKRTYLQRGLLDEDIVNGEVTLAQSGQGIFRTWWEFISSASFAIRDVKPQAPSEILTISGDTGVVATRLVMGDVTGKTVVIRTNVAGQGKRVSWTGTVLQVNDTTITLKNWNWGNCAGGTIAVADISFESLKPAIVEIPQRVRNRQTGRPFGLSRGRQSNR